MKILLKILISLILIFASLILIWFIKSMQPSLFPTTYLILIAGSSVNLIAGIGLLLIAIQLAKRKIKKSEQFTPEKIEKALEEGISGWEKYIENRLIFIIGAIAAYSKPRGKAVSRLTETGEYDIYKKLKEGVKRFIENIMRRNPDLRKESYALPLLSQIEDPYVGQTLEILAKMYEMYKKLGMEYVPKDGLKKLASILEKYVKKRSYLGMSEP